MDLCCQKLGRWLFIVVQPDNDQVICLFSTQIQIHIFDKNQCSMFYWEVKKDQKLEKISFGHFRIVSMMFCIWVGHPFTTTVVEKSDWRLSMRRLGKQKQMILAFKVVHICFLSNGGSPLSFDPIRNIKSNTVPHSLLNHAKKMPKWKEHGNAIANYLGR